MLQIQQKTGKEKELAHSTTWVNFIDIRINKRKQTQKSTLKNRQNLSMLLNVRLVQFSQSTTYTENFFKCKFLGPRCTESEPLVVCALTRLPDYSGVVITS